MKKLLIVFAVGLIVMLASVTAGAVSLTVDPGATLGGGALGLSIGPLEVQGGADLFFIGFSEEDFDEGDPFDAAEGIRVVAPQLGLKLRLAGSGADVIPYLRGSVALLQPSFVIKSNSDPEDAAEYEAELNESLEPYTFYAGQLAIGAEHPFSPGFRIAGEFGIRGLVGQREYVGVTDPEDPDYDSELAGKLLARLRAGYSATYGKLGLVFVF